MTPEERAHEICMTWYASEHFELEHLRVAIVDAILEARTQALEEAAKVAEGYDVQEGWGDVKIIAAAIRALKDHSPQQDSN